MRKRTKYAVRTVLIASAVVAAAALTLQPSGGQDTSGDFGQILGTTPNAAARKAGADEREISRAALRTAVAAANSCITDRLQEAGRSKGLELQVTVTDPSSVANDDDLALNWGYSVNGRELTEKERSDFQLVASAIEIDCQKQHFDAAAAAHRKARRADRAFMNEKATSLAKCLRLDQDLLLTVPEIRKVVRALADGSRPAEPLASKVNRSAAMRDSITRCMLQSPDITDGLVR